VAPTIRRDFPLPPIDLADEAGDPESSQCFKHGGRTPVTSSEEFGERPLPSARGPSARPRTHLRTPRDLKAGRCAGMMFVN
jgi:hypothetical protein